MDISNSSDNTIVVGTSGADSINNKRGDYVTIYTYAGNDSIINGGEYVTIYAGIGNDSIFNYGDWSTLNAGDGKDTIINISAQKSSINAGDDADYIYNYSDRTTVIGGSDNDSIIDNSQYSILNGGAGDDIVSLNNYVSGNGILGYVNGGIFVGKEVEHIYSSVIYENGDGNDTIFGFDVYDTIVISRGTYSVSLNSSDTIIKVGNGKIILKNYTDFVNITGTHDENTDHYINNVTSNKVINGTDYNNLIHNKADDVTINGGANDDNILSRGYSSNVNGGFGNDSIYDYSDDSTINGGAGDDIISLGWHYYTQRSIIYSDGDGNDTVYGYNSGDEINIKDGLYSTMQSGADTIIKVGNEQIVLKDYKDKLNIIGKRAIDTLITGSSEADSITNTSSHATINAGNGNDTIENYSSASMSAIYGGDGDDSINNHSENCTIDGGDGNDSIRNYVFHYDYGYHFTINGGKGNDYIYNSHGFNSTIDGSDGNDFIDNYLGVRLIINGGDGDDSIFSYGTYSTIDGGAGNDFVSLHGSSEQVIKYANGNGNDTIVGYQSTDTINITNGAYLTQQSGSDTIIKVGNGQMLLKDYTGSLNVIGTFGTNGSDSPSNYSDEPTINGGDPSNIINSDKSYATVNGTDNDDFIYNSGTSVQINTGYGNDTVYNVGDYSTLNGGNGDDHISNAGGRNSTVVGGEGNDYISIYEDNYYINVNGGAGDDTIYNSGYYSIVNGSYGNDRIINYGSNSMIDGGTGNDSIRNDIGSTLATIQGGAGDDQISLDSGYALIQYSNGDGNDVLFNYSLTDTIDIQNGKYSTLVNGNDTIIKVGNGQVLIKNYIGSVNIIGERNIDTLFSNSVSNTVINGSAYSDSIINSGNRTTINAGNGNDSIYNNGSYSVIEGGAGNDTVQNSGSSSTIYGGTGNDTIRNLANSSTVNGGSGNDFIFNIGSFSTVEGGANDDVVSLSNYTYTSVIYADGDGNDTILGFKSKDTIIVSSGTYSTSLKGNDTIVKVGNDQILVKNYTDSLKIVGERSIDTLFSNSATSTVITGSTYADFINNSGTGTTINSGEGNDTIVNKGGYSYIDGGADSEHISNSGTYSSIYGGAGNDTIEMSYIGSHSTVVGGINNDVISLNGFQSDMVIQYAEGDGYDTIIGYQSTDTINIINGRYSTQQSGNNAIVKVGSGQILIKDYMGELNIIGTPVFSGDGIFIDNTIANTIITGTQYADSLSNNASNVTINAGAGNDSIRLSGNAEIINYTKGDGNDIIFGTTSNTTLNIVNGKYSTLIDGTDSIVKIGNGQILVKNYTGALNIIGTLDGGKSIENVTSNTIIGGTAYDDTLSNVADNVQLNGDNGDDVLYNNAGSNITILGGDGNDSVYNDFAEYISISGDAGDDSIFGTDNYATLDGGAGNDTLTGNHFRSIVNGGYGYDYISLGSYWYNTIEGGKGNDVIRFNGSNNLIKYAAGDGNDSVYGFGANDTLTITGGSYSRSTVDNDVYVSLNGGTIILKGAKGKSININNENLSVDTVDAVDTNTPQDVIKRFMKSLDDSTEPVMIDMLNNAIKDASGGKYSNIQDVIDQMIADCQKYNAADDKNGWRRFLLEKCDINLDNADTGAISGYDAGGSDEEKTLENIISEDTNLNTSFTDAYFNIGNLNFGGLNVYLAKQTPSNTVERINYTDSSLKTEERKTWQGMQSGWLSNAFNLIGKSYGSNFGFGSKSTSTLQENSLYVTFKNAKSDEVASVSPGNINNKGETKGPLNLNVNIHHFPAFRDGTVSDAYINASDDYIGNSYYFERILAHELTHAVMDANILNATGENGLPQFIKEGMAELTHGCDDNRQDEISMYAGSPDSLKEALDLKPSGNYGAYAGGYMFLRYIAKQFSSKGESDSYDVAIQSPSDAYIEPPEGMMIIGSSLLSVSSAFADDRIAFSDYGADINKANATALKNDVAILGGTLNDSINSGSKNDKLYGGDGNDTLIGNAGDDTLTGGSGSDLFVYDNGDDVIADYAAGVDKIQLRNCSIANSTLEGDDVIINTDGGALIVKDGRDQLITVIDRDGVETTQIYGKNILTADNVADFDGVTLKSSKLTLDAPFTGSVNLADFSSKVKKVDATKTTSAVEIIGNDKGNTFKAGSGGSTLDGGGKNDKLYGGDGYDVFIFDGQGKDKIYNYAAGDRIILTADVTKSKLSGKNLKITVEGGGVLTVNKIFDVEMTITTSDGQTNSYLFDKKHKTLEDALNNSAAQFSSDYWFLNNPSEESPLSSIVSTDNAVDFDYDQTIETIKPSMNALITSARHRQKK